jgi:hypothetical protein
MNLGAFALFSPRSCFSAVVVRFSLPFGPRFSPQKRAFWNASPAALATLSEAAVLL